VKADPTIAAVVKRATHTGSSKTLRPPSRTVSCAAKRGSPTIIPHSSQTTRS
jgi:hypothetical protein